MSPGCALRGGMLIELIIRWYRRSRENLSRYSSEPRSTVVETISRTSILLTAAENSL